MQNTALQAVPRPDFPPKVSVIMPVYNTAPYLENAVRSILQQSFADFELIAIDDGSTDGSGEMLERLAAEDARIRVLHQQNGGVPKALNAGLKAARGMYIARMDSDDEAHPHRFNRQVAALDARPDVVVLGTQFRLIDPEGRPLKVMHMPLDHASLDRKLYEKQELAICHPSAMIRADALERIGGYDETFSSAQDIDLFLRLAEVGELANLDDVLMHYRIHTRSKGYTNRPEQMQNAWRAGRRAAIRRNRAFKTPRPDRADGQRNKADVCRMWGWWALAGGHVDTARLYARRAVMANPLSLHNWRLAITALRGH